MAFDKPQRHVDRIFLHCSASDRLEHDDVEVIRDWHVNGNGWSDIGYHYFIKKDGTIEPGRDLERTPAAQKGNNSGTIAICLHGLAAEKFTKAQYKIERYEDAIPTVYEAYEKDRKQRLGIEADQPHRIKYKPLTR